MENVHAERSAGWSALAYVGVLIIATVLTAGMPAIDVRPADAALTIDEHRTMFLLGAWLTFPAAGFFLWFLTGLRTYLGNAPGRQEGLPTFAVLSGVVMIAVSIFAAALQTAALYQTPDTFVSDGLSALANAFVFSQGGLGYAPVAIFLFGAAHSMRRHDSAPPWLAILGYVAAAGAGISTLSIFFGGIMGPGGVASAFIGALPAAAWIIATGLELIQNKRGSGGASTSAAS
jgi:hypothetical protein